MLEKLFQLSKNKTTIRTEVLAGISTFLTMSYIIFINPSILSLTGMDQGSVFVATCLTAAIGSALMGLLANYPIALAPGMGLNIYFTYSVVLGSGYSWQAALGAVFVAGIFFLCLSISPIRQHIMASIPKSLKVAIVAGIGFFLAIIGFKNAGIITHSTATLVTHGNLHDQKTLLAALGFFLIIGLDALGIVGSIIISILSISIISIFLELTPFAGIFSIPPSISPTFLQMDIKAALTPAMATIIFAFLFVELFDNTGTLIGVAHRAGLIGKDGKLPRINRVLIADSTSAIVGATLGTSTTTSYLESVVGVRGGGRTGLMAVTIAICFLLALFLSPLAKSIPSFATAPALIYVAILMSKAMIEIDWNDITEYAPAVITVISMPLTFSIAEGISFGFITYTAIKLISGRYRDLNITILLLTLTFLIKYIIIN